MPKDYSYLEGTEFAYHMSTQTIHAKVLYADYAIGITCVAVDDPDNYLICFRGATGAKAAGQQPDDPKIYQAVWMSLINQIVRGHVRAHQLIHAVEVAGKRHGTNKCAYVAKTLSPEACAFGQ